MSSLKRAIRLLPDEDQLLRHLYVEYQIPSDQYARRPDDLARFIAVWNNLSGRNDTAEDVKHYIVTQRKQKVKKWPTFNGKHKRLDGTAADLLSPNEWAILQAIYLRVVVPRNIGSDNLAYNGEIAAQVSQEFYRMTRRVIHGQLLFAAIMAKRKRGEAEWIKVNPASFGDIDAV